MKVQVKNRRTVPRNVILAQFVANPHTDYPVESCVKEKGSFDEDSTLDENTDAKGNSINNKSNTTSSFVPSEVLLESNTQFSSNTNLETSTASDSSLDLLHVSSNTAGVLDTTSTIPTAALSSVNRLHVSLHLTTFFDVLTTLRTGRSYWRLGRRRQWQIAWYETFHHNNDTMITFNVHDTI